MKQKKLLGFGLLEGDQYPGWHYDAMVFASTLIYYHTHIQTHTGHTGTNRLTHTYKYILIPYVMYTQQLPVLHWVNNLLIEKLQRSTISLLLKNNSLAKVIHLMITFKKTKSLLWNTKNTDRNGIIKQNTHHTQRGQKGLVGVCKWYSPF